MNWTSGVSRYIFDLLTIKYICVCPDSERFQSRFVSRVVESACFNPLKTTQCKAISCISQHWHTYPHRWLPNLAALTWPLCSIMAMAKNLMTAMVEFLTANESDVPCYWFSMFSHFDMTFSLLIASCCDRESKEKDFVWTCIPCYEAFRIHSVLA